MVGNGRGMVGRLPEGGGSRGIGRQGRKVRMRERGRERHGERKRGRERESKTARWIVSEHTTRAVTTVSPLSPLPSAPPSVI